MEEIDLYAEFDSDEELNNWIDSYLKFEEVIKNSPFWGSITSGSMKISHVFWIMAMIIFKFNMIKAKSLPEDKRLWILRIYLIERCLKIFFCKIDVDNSARIKFAQAFHAIGTVLENNLELKIPRYDLYNVLYILEYRLINAACYSDIEATNMVLAFKEHLGLNVLFNVYGDFTDEKKLKIKQEVYSEANGPDYF